MKNSTNTFRYIYHGSMIVLNQVERFALTGYFFRRNIPLSNFFVKINGETYYKVNYQKELEITDIEKEKIPNAA